MVSVRHRIPGLLSASCGALLHRSRLNTVPAPQLLFPKCVGDERHCSRGGHVAFGLPPPPSSSASHDWVSRKSWRSNRIFAGRKQPHDGET